MAKQDWENLDPVTALFPVGERPWASMRALRTCVAAIILSGAVLSGANAAAPKGSSQEAATPPQIAELTALLGDPKNRLMLTLLADPTVQKWLEKQGVPATATRARDKPDESVSSYFDTRIREIREHVVALASTLPDLPNQFERGMGLLQAEIPRRGTVALLVLASAAIANAASRNSSAAAFAERKRLMVVFSDRKIAARCPDVPCGRMKADDRLDYHDFTTSSLRRATDQPPPRSALLTANWRG
jgi:hypothetical protein